MPIYAQGPRWYWSIYGLNLRGPIPTGVVVHGLADDLAAAKAAFKSNWEKLLATGTMRLPVLPPVDFCAARKLS